MPRDHWGHPGESPLHSTPENYVRSRPRPEFFLQHRWSPAGRAGAGASVEDDEEAVVVAQVRVPLPAGGVEDGCGGLLHQGGGLAVDERLGVGGAERQAGSARETELARRVVAKFVHVHAPRGPAVQSEEHTSELQSRFDIVCRLLLEKKKK